jgi:hypothetical protein
MKKRESNLNVNIEIHYISESKILQRGSFPLRGRSPEQIAYDFWKHIKKEMPYPLVLEEVLAAGEDVTDLVRDLEKQELLNVMNDNLPF